MNRNGPARKHSETGGAGSGTARPGYAQISLADKVVSELNERQVPAGPAVRQVVLDHLLRSILSKAGFDPVSMVAELRGYRTTVDSIIDHYVPTAARVLGEKWTSNEIDFAFVTIGAMRLQALLSEASDETTDLFRAKQNALHAIIVIPQGEQHFLGAFVLAAQLRRYGCRVELSFGEDQALLMRRVRLDTPDMMLLTCARVASLETIGQIVLNIRQVTAEPPAFVVGGAFCEDVDAVLEMTGVDLVTNKAKEALSFYNGLGRGKIGQAGR